MHVTLMMYKEQMASQLVCQQSAPTLSLHAVTEFCDLVPRTQFGEDGEDLVQGNFYFAILHTSGVPPPRFVFLSAEAR